MEDVVLLLADDGVFGVNWSGHCREATQRNESHSMAQHIGRPLYAQKARSPGPIHLVLRAVQGRLVLARPSFWRRARCRCQINKNAPLCLLVAEVQAMLSQRSRRGTGRERVFCTLARPPSRAELEVEKHLLLGLPSEDEAKK